MVLILRGFGHPPSPKKPHVLGRTFNFCSTRGSSVPKDMFATHSFVKLILVACLLKDCKNGEEKENGETLIREREWRDSDVR